MTVMRADEGSEPTEPRQPHQICAPSAPTFDWKNGSGAAAAAPSSLGYLIKIKVDVGQKILCIQRKTLTRRLLAGTYGK